AWTFAHASSRPLDAWTRKRTADQAGALLNPPQFEWRGRAFAVKSDESLVSPDLVVGTETFVILFRHRYTFESRLGFFDGGVIELSSDGGNTWGDIALLVDPGYTQTLTRPTPPSGGDNPLAGRRAFAGTLTNFRDVRIDLGTRLAGQTVKLRFR